MEEAREALKKLNIFTQKPIDQLFSRRWPRKFTPTNQFVSVELTDCGGSGVEIGVSAPSPRH
jgi:hypothetical protein